MLGRSFRTGLRFPREERRGKPLAKTLDHFPSRHFEDHALVGMNSPRHISPTRSPCHVPDLGGARFNCSNGCIASTVDFASNAFARAVDARARAYLDFVSSDIVSNGTFDFVLGVVVDFASTASARFREALARAIRSASVAFLPSRKIIFRTVFEMPRFRAVANAFGFAGTATSDVSTSSCLI